MTRALRRRAVDIGEHRQVPGAGTSVLVRRQAEAAVRTSDAEALTTDAAAHLQRTHGNAAVSDLVAQRWVTGTAPTTPPTTTTGATIGSRSSSSPPRRPPPPTPGTYGTKKDKLNKYQVVWGGATGARTGKKVVGAAQQVAGGNDAAVQSGVQQAQKMSQNASQGASLLRQGSLFAAQGAFNAMLAPVMGIVGMITGLAKVVLTFKKALKLGKNVKVFEDAKKQAKPKAAAGDTGAATALASISYGLAKVRRFLAETWSKFALGLAKTVSKIITFVSGGTTLVVTGVIDLLTSAGKAVIQLYRGGKAIFKALRGTKGVNRKKNAETLLEQVRTGNQPEARMLLFGLKAGKQKWIEKQLGRKPTFVEQKKLTVAFARAKKGADGVKTIRFGHVMLKDFFPDAAAYQTWLGKLSPGELQDVHADIAKKLRSTGSAKTTFLDAAKAVRKV